MPFLIVFRVSEMFSIAGFGIEIAESQRLANACA